MAPPVPHPALFAPVGVMAPPADASFAFQLLARHGQRPIGFYGRVLVAYGGPGTPAVTQASRLVLYELAGGGFAAAISHGPISHGQAGDGVPLWQDAITARSAEALLAQLHAHDPVALPLTSSASGGTLPAQGVARAWRALRATVLRDAA